MAEAAATIIDTGTPPTGTATPAPAPSPAPTPPATPAAAPTIASGDVDPPSTAQNDWPEDWRQRVAKQLGKEFGGDEKVLKLLERRGSPVDVAKWALNADKKIAAGEFKRVLPEKPTDEELSAWRQENSVPDEWAKYSKDLGDGTVFSDEDNKIIDGFLQDAHKVNMPQPYVKQVLGFYRNLQENALQEQVTFDKTFKQNSLLELTQEYGAEFKTNIAAVGQLFDNAPEGLYANLMSARTADGKLIGDHPDIIRWLTGVAKEVNPLATLGGNSVTSEGLEDEIESFQKRMREDNEGWHKDKKAQARLQTLLERKEQMKDR